jgi:hypothetical protein
MYCSAFARSLASVVDAVSPHSSYSGTTNGDEGSRTTSNIPRKGFLQLPRTQYNLVIMKDALYNEHVNYAADLIRTAAKRWWNWFSTTPIIRPVLTCYKIYTQSYMSIWSDLLRCFQIHTAEKEWSILSHIYHLVRHSCNRKRCEM